MPLLNNDTYIDTLQDKYYTTERVLHDTISKKPSFLVAPLPTSVELTWTRTAQLYRYIYATFVRCKRLSVSDHPASTLLGYKTIRRINKHGKYSASPAH